MAIEPTLQRILDRALEGKAPAREDCVRLLEFPEGSLEAGILKAFANSISRNRFKNHGVLLGQIGIETSACPGDCKFCAFAASHTRLPGSRLSPEEILAKARDFTRDGDLYALFLMTMHEFDMRRLLAVVALLKKEIPPQTQIVLNIGDFDLAAAKELKSAGANGAYHILRLREGIDTKLDPAKRRQTIEAIRGAGLHFYYGCEPVGPEHSPDELADQLLVGVEYGCFQHCAMRRVYLPNSPLARLGQITEQRLAQITAVLVLATLECKETGNIAVHEPNLLGLSAGANAIYAETGANPRDTVADTSAGRGMDMNVCRRMLYEAGFESVLRGDGSITPLTHTVEREVLK
jgi:biotin synthase